MTVVTRRQSFPWERAERFCRLRVAAHGIPAPARRCVDPEDLVQEVCLELLRAWPRFDPARGRFSAWLSVRVRCALRDFRRRWTNGKRGGVAVSIAEGDTGDIPKIAHAYRRGDYLVSVQGAMGSSARTASDRAEVNEVAERARAALPRREWVILMARFEGYTLEEVGRRFGLDRHRVRQIENEALGELRKRFAP